MTRLLAARDPAALEKLYDRYAGILYGVCVQIVGDGEQAEAVMHEVFQKIWNSKEASAPVGSLLSVIVRMARDTAMDKKRSREYASRPRSVSSGSQVTYNPDTENLRRAAGRLEPEHKEVLDLMYFQGLTQIEVALKLHLSLATVKTRAREAVLRLRTLLNSEGS